MKFKSSKPCTRKLPRCSLSPSQTSAIKQPIILICRSNVVILMANRHIYRIIVRTLKVPTWSSLLVLEAPWTNKWRLLKTWFWIAMIHMPWCSKSSKVYATVVWHAKRFSNWSNGKTKSANPSAWFPSGVAAVKFFRKVLQLQYSAHLTSSSNFWSSQSKIKSVKNSTKERYSNNITNASWRWTNITFRSVNWRLTIS